MYFLQEFHLLKGNTDLNNVEQQFINAQLETLDAVIFFFKAGYATAGVIVQVSMLF